MNKLDPTDIEGLQRVRNDALDKVVMAAKVEKEDFIWLMSSKRGRRIAHRILDRAGVWRLSFNTNALQMAFNEGTRNEGLAITGKLMSYCPEQYGQMLTENRE
jgi:hypothetical protein